MADLLIALAILVVAGAYLVHRVRKGGSEKKDEVDAEAPRNVERGRAASEAAAAAPAHLPLSEADAAAVAELHEYFQEIGTGEQPVVATVRKRHVYRGPTARQLDAMRSRLLAPIRRFEADPLAAPIPDLHDVAEPALFGTAVEQWFAPQAEPSFPALPAEPEPWALESFTTDVWKAADFSRSGGAR